LVLEKLKRTRKHLKSCLFVTRKIY